MKRVTRYRLLAAGGIAILLATVGVAYIVVTGTRTVDSGGGGPMDWGIAAVATLVIVGVSWILLSQRRTDDSGKVPFVHAPCSTCGHEVLGQWRMCPYCGAMIRRNRSPRAAETAPEQSS
jgi:ribosomal protein L32